SLGTAARKQPRERRAEEHHRAEADRGGEQAEPQRRAHQRVAQPFEKAGKPGGARERDQREHEEEQQGASGSAGAQQKKGAPPGGGAAGGGGGGAERRGG